MKKKIEDIWREGFMNEALTMPKLIQDFYNTKSIHLVDELIESLEKEVNLIIPFTVLVVAINYVFGNDNNIIWSLIIAMPMILFYYYGKKQAKELRDIAFGVNCYVYLLSIKSFLSKITQFNKALSYVSILAILIPSIVFTYSNQKGKSVGEVIGIDSMDWSISWILLLIPFFALVFFIVIEILFRKTTSARMKNIDRLLDDMNELKGLST